MPNIVVRIVKAADDVIALHLAIFDRQHPIGFVVGGISNSAIWISRVRHQANAVALVTGQIALWIINFFEPIVLEIAIVDGQIVGIG